MLSSLYIVVQTAALCTSLTFIALAVMFFLGHADQDTLLRVFTGAFGAQYVASVIAYMCNGADD